MTTTSPPQHSPPENPLRTLRKSQRLSLDALARRAHVSRQLVIRAEQAVYADPPPRLLRHLMETSDPGAVGALAEDVQSVYHFYYTYQIYVRKSNYGKLIVNFDWSTVPVGVHPFVDWRLRSGLRARIGPAKFFCVHPALLHKYEVQPHLVQSTPGDLQRALLESGYSSEILASLAEAYDTYKEHLSEQFKEQQRGFAP